MAKKSLNNMAKERRAWGSVGSPGALFPPN